MESENINNLKFNEDYKLLGTIHTISDINEYYHVRVKYNNGDTKFYFKRVTTTKNKIVEEVINEKEIPQIIKLK